MKYSTYIAVVASIAAVAFGTVAFHGRTAAADADGSPLFAYRIVTLASAHPSVQQDILNQWARNGWELITVDERQAYLKRRLR
ncbi:MAG: hypothetical protein IT209_13065 [Armatimonadetes bacterium]|nr:hypothetical protein [Armatimonadota bacterium]